MEAVDAAAGPLHDELSTVTHSRSTGRNEWSVPVSLDAHPSTTAHPGGTNA